MSDPSSNGWGAAGDDVDIKVFNTRRNQSAPQCLPSNNQSDDVGVPEESSNGVSRDTGVIGTPSNEEDAYRMSSGGKRMVIIFNHKEFKRSLDLTTRQGTDKDKERLQKTFKDLGFGKVKAYDDLDCEEVYQKLDKVRKKDHTKTDCFVCVFLSHGNSGTIYARDKEISLKKVQSKFKGKNCPTLVGKPKLFFVQACRGTKTDEGIQFDGPSKKPKSEKVRTISSESDVLTAYAVVDEMFAFKSDSGSYFIQYLCDVLSADWKKLDLLHILTRVNRKMSYEFQSNVPSDSALDKKKQSPCIVSTLTKQLFFYPRE